MERRSRLKDISKQSGWGELSHPLCFDMSSKCDLRSIKYSTNIRPIYYWLIMGSYKKIGMSHEMGLIDTPPFALFIYVFFTIHISF